MKSSRTRPRWSPASISRSKRSMSSPMSAAYCSRCASSSALVLVQGVVHRPVLVFALGRGRLRRLGGVLRVRVVGADREVAEHEAQPLPHALLDVLHDGVGLPAVGALV